MSAANADKSKWIQQNYDKLLLVLMLVALLASALYLLLRIRGERNEIEQGSWQNPSRPVPAEPLDLTPYVVSNAPLTDPFMGTEVTTNLLLASEERVTCESLVCARPIPYRALVCPYCGVEQQPVGAKRDSDNDGVDDETERELGMDPWDPNDAFDDYDDDGFTNLEEVLSGTDIKDPLSTPPPGAKLRLTRARATPFPLVFVGALGRDESQKFQLNTRRQDRTYFVRLNEEVIGWKAVEYLSDTDDGETLILEKGEERMALVRDRPTQGKDWGCNLISLLKGEQYKNLKKDSEIEVKGYTYIVVDIQRHQVVIKDANSGEEITVPLITKLEVQDLKTRLSGGRTGGAGMGGLEFERRGPMPRPRR